MSRGASLLADLLVPRGPEFSLNPREPLAALRTLVLLGSLVCLLVMLARLYRAKGLLHGILGIISCGIYPFVWGWMAPAEWRTRGVMLLWAGLIVAAILLVLVSPRPQPRPRPFPRPLPIPESTPPVLPEAAKPQ